MEEDGSGTLLRRTLATLHKAVRAARAIARLRPSPTTTTTTPATTPSRLPPSLLDCIDDDDAAWTAGSPSFHTASSTPDGAVHSRLPSPGAVEVDVDRRAAEFIERFWRNGSLELRYCSPVMPARPPVSPDTYFNLSRLHGAVHDHGSPVHARPAYGRVSPRPSGMSIKWPNSPNLRGRPSVQV